MAKVSDTIDSMVKVSELLATNTSLCDCRIIMASCYATVGSWLRVGSTRTRKGVDVQLRESKA